MRRGGGGEGVGRDEWVKRGREVRYLQVEEEYFVEKLNNQVSIRREFPRVDHLNLTTILYFL